MAHKGTQAILLQDVEKLGRKGDVVNVAAGYMRNYLQPRKLALQASDGMVAQVRRQEELRRRHEAQSDDQAQDIAHTLNRTVLTIKARVGRRGPAVRLGHLERHRRRDLEGPQDPGRPAQGRARGADQGARLLPGRRSTCGATSTPPSR